jgi:hypothetical protein
MCRTSIGPTSVRMSTAGFSQYQYDIPRCEGLSCLASGGVANHRRTTDGPSDPPAARSLVGA